MKTWNKKPELTEPQICLQGDLFFLNKSDQRFLPNQRFPPKKIHFLFWAFSWSHVVYCAIFSAPRKRNAAPLYTALLLLSYSLCFSHSFTLSSGETPPGMQECTSLNASRGVLIWPVRLLSRKEYTLVVGEIDLPDIWNILQWCPGWCHMTDATPCGVQNFRSLPWRSAPVCCCHHPRPENRNDRSLPSTLRVESLQKKVVFAATTCNFLWNWLTIRLLVDAFMYYYLRPPFEKASLFSWIYFLQKFVHFHYNLNSGFIFVQFPGESKLALVRDFELDHFWSWVRAKFWSILAIFFS